jgi:hypothetical protein
MTEYYSMQQFEALRPHLERQLPTYGTMKKSQLEAFDIYHREKLEAALATLGRILQQDEIDELRFRIDEECEKQERRLANLRQAGRAMEELRTRIGYEEKISLDFDTGKIIHTPMGDFWIALRGLLEEFWTA